MTVKSVLILALTGLLGFWLFFQVYGRHQADTALQTSKMERERAEFDATFEKAFTGKADLALDQRAEAAKATEREIAAKSLASKNIAAKKMEAMEKQTEKLADVDDTADDKILQDQLNSRP